MTVSIEQAQLNLAELIQQSAKGESITITQDGREVAQIIRVREGNRRPAPGFGRDVVHIISDDEEHLAGFADYMK